MSRKNLYLILACIGFLIPNILVVMESVETGNIMLYADPMSTISSMFENRIASIFAIDLLFAVVVFFVWSYLESDRLSMKRPYTLWLITMLFGLAGALPLFLYQREAHI